jgi:outer membrane lipoprotein-sorting protein
MKWLALRTVPVLLLIPVLAGCATGFGQQITAEEIVQKMRDTVKNTQTVHSTVDLLVNIDREGLKKRAGGMAPGVTGKAQHIDELPDSASATLEVWRQKPDKVRVEVDNSTIEEMQGAILASDGQKFYAYSAAKNTLYTGMLDEMDTGHSRWMDMMKSDDLEQALDKLIAASDIKLVGTEQVAGRNTYRLEITPRPDAADGLDLPQAMRTQVAVLLNGAKATLWVDKDRWIPLKLVLEHPDVGRFNYTAVSLELNQPIDPALFVVQAPPGAKTVELEARPQPQSDPQPVTIQQARQVALQEGWKLLEPAYVPDNATLVEVLRVIGAGRHEGDALGPLTFPAGSDRPGFQLTYASPDADFTLSEFYAGDAAGLPDSLSKSQMVGAGEITVRGVKGLVFEDKVRRYTSLVWFEKEPGIFMVVSGKLTLEEALKIAEGLK